MCFIADTQYRRVNRGLGSRRGNLGKSHAVPPPSDSRADSGHRVWRWQPPGAAAVRLLAAIAATRRSPTTPPPDQPAAGREVPVNQTPIATTPTPRPRIDLGQRGGRHRLVRIAGDGAARAADGEPGRRDPFAGDIAYDRGTLEEFRRCFDPALRALPHAVLGGARQSRIHDARRRPDTSPISATAPAPSAAATTRCASRAGRC